MTCTGKAGDVHTPLGEREVAMHDLDRAAAAVGELAAAGVPRRQASRIVGELTEVSANQLYRASL